MDSRAKSLVEVGSKLFEQKSQYDSLCQEIAENFHPLRSDFTSSFTLGQEFVDTLMDSSPVQARETLGNTVGAILRQDDWFHAHTGYEEIDEDPSVARWQEAATKRFRRMIYDRDAQLTRTLVEVDHDWVSFGGGVLSVGENQSRDRFLFQAWHPRDCAYIENADRIVDRLHRKMKPTARAIMGNPVWRKNAHEDIRKAAEKEPTKEFEVQHVMLPVDEVYGDDKARRRRLGKMKFLSFYIDCAHETVLGEGGLPVFSYVVPRWRTVGRFPYPFSPAATIALPDARMLQSMARVLLESGEKAVDPPTIGKGNIFKDDINLYAGGHTMVDLEDADDIRKVFQTVEQGGDLGFGLDMKQDVRFLIAEAWLLNKITLPPQEKTALETRARLEEYRRAILPFIGPIESDYHLPLLETAFELAMHNEAFDFDDMPRKMEGVDLTFKFDSPLNTAEGRQDVQAFQESIQILAAASQFDSTIPTTVKIKDMTKDAVKGTGAPADWFNDEEQQVEDEDAQKQVAGLVSMAEMLKGGAEVGGAVADTALKLQQAGMAA